METKPYGGWKSPITSDLIVAETISLGAPTIDGEDIYWIEGRPKEMGRQVLVKRSGDGTISDVTPSPFNVRTRVHEYGGGSYSVINGTVYFSDFADQKVYWQPQGSNPVRLTGAEECFFADGVIDEPRDRMYAIREDHSQEGQEAVNTLVAMALEDGKSTVLAGGYDFYASPRLSSTGKKLAWLSWRHPNMPWDGTELWTAEIKEDGRLSQPVLVAGGKDESIFQPEWSPNGVLHFISDRTGWWNLYAWRDGEVKALCPKFAEFGLPQWVFGMSTYGFANENRIICTYIENGETKLANLYTATGNLEDFAVEYKPAGTLKVSKDFAVYVGGSSTNFSAVVKLDLATGKEEVLRRSTDLQIDEGYLAIPETIEFPTEDNLTAFAFFYAPKNKDFSAPEGEKPPVIIVCHGGPTGSTSTMLSLSIQYWTSRGIGVLDVNYGGSTGYGREYRERLNLKWGIVDIDDCVNGAKYLIEQGRADGNRLAIRGGSAGGYTTLAALTFREVFRAGASYFGVSDLEALAKETHKFESRYLDNMVGAYPAEKQVYFDRSPINFTDNLNCPLILFQGLEDKVVPPNQAEMMYEAIKKKGIPVAYVPFEGEQHGFRQAKNIKRALDGEFYFYSKVFGFEPADNIEPVAIDNL
jgi:dipeptidyl aminopeptidase/acylaminoacyl peptidase